MAGNRVVYAGETHRAYLDRQLEHRQALNTNNQAYATVRHHKEQHPELEKLFSFRMVKEHKTSLERQICEALLMESLEVDALIGTVQATDLDVGRNGYIKYTIKNQTQDLPIRLDQTSGEIFLTQKYTQSKK